MALLDWILPKLRGINYLPLAVFGLVLLLIGIVMIYPEIGSAAGIAADVVKHALSAAAGITGLYILYRSLASKSKIDDMIGLVSGFVLLGIAVYTELGTFMTSIFTNVADFLVRSTAYIVAAAFALTGVMIASKTRSKLLSILLILAALAILGVSLLNVFR